MITDDDMTTAISNIARTADGLRLYRWLQRELLAVPPFIESCALTAHHGERRFAAKLMGLMADAIAEQAVDEPDHDIPGRGASERPVVFVPAQPVGRRRVTARDFLAAQPDHTTDRSD